MVQGTAERNGQGLWSITRTGSPAPTEGGGPERRLLEALRRAARQPQGRMALVLHLSRLAPPAPRPHHRRIARAIMEDTAERHEGEVFALGNSDLVLLCREASPSRRPPTPGSPPRLAPADPGTLPATLARLLRIDAPDPARATTVWPLETALDELAAYVADRLAESAAALPLVAPEPGQAGALGQTGAVNAIARIAEGTVITDLLVRQTGVLVSAPSADGGSGNSLRPLYREVGFSMAALEARLATGDEAAADPFLFRHLAGRLDHRMLAWLSNAAGAGGGLDIAAAGRGTPPLHINLTVPAILSDEFTRFALLCRSFGATIGVEVALVEAAADVAAFGRARHVLAEAGLVLVLDGVSHLALTLARPCALRPDLLKLDWSPRLAALPADEYAQVEAAIERIGPQRVVLQHTDREAAVHWGMAHGIRRFQGRHVDAMLAAGRTLFCGHAAGCTLRQCIERSAATGPAGRAGCRFPALLDAVPPDRSPSRAGHPELVGGMPA
jgi:hypothetical protein